MGESGEMMKRSRGSKGKWQSKSEEKEKIKTKWEGKMIPFRRVFATLNPLILHNQGKF